MPPAPVHVHPHRAAIELDPRAGAGGAVDDFLEVDLVGLALEKQAARRVAEHGNVLVFHRVDDALGHFVLVLRHRVVDGGDDVVELRHDIVGEVELAVLEDVDLAAGEDMKVLHLLVEFRDHPDLLRQPLLVEAIRLIR